MSKYTGPRCRLCRREGAKLFLKGARCNTPKCTFEHRDYPPGAHNWRRGKVSDFGVQMREKQKVKHYYGVLEKQFRRFYQQASRMPGNTGESLLVLLERRLDNVVRRLYWAHNVADARQLVSHGHICVNGRKIDRPAYLVSTGDLITPKSAERSRNAVQVRFAQVSDPRLPSWLELDAGNLRATVKSMPVRDEVPIEIHEQLVVEFCSR